MEKNKIVEIKDLGLNYHTLDEEIRALKDVNLYVYSNEIIGIVAGLLKPSYGQVIINKDIIKSPLKWIQ